MATTPTKKSTPNLGVNEDNVEVGVDENNGEIPLEGSTSTELARAEPDADTSVKLKVDFQFEINATDDASVFNECHNKIDQEFKKAVVLILGLGKALIERKSSLKHGEWGKQFGEGGFAFTQQWANCYMTAYENRHMLTGEENCMQQMLSAIKEKRKTKKTDKGKSYVYKYEIAGFTDIKEVADSCKTTKEDLKVALDQAIANKIGQLRGEK